MGISLVVQWLRIYFPMQGAQVQSLVGELRSHMPVGNQAHVPYLLSLCSRAQELQQRAHTVKTNKQRKNALTEWHIVQTLGSDPWIQISAWLLAGSMALGESFDLCVLQSPHL